MREPLQALTPKELTETSVETLGYYQQFADEFVEGTKDHDVSQNIEALLRNIVGDSAYDILDFGCGPGRDLLVFKQIGHRPIGVDGCRAFVDMARKYTGCEVWHQDFLDLQLPSQRFDGIFANASIFHVPTQELNRVLQQLYDCLKSEGVLFCSNPRGSNIEQYSGGRYGAFLEWKTWRAFVINVGFTELEHYYRPSGQPREQQPWLATLWRKSENPKFKAGVST